MMPFDRPYVGYDHWYRRTNIKMLVGVLPCLFNHYWSVMEVVNVAPEAFEEGHSSGHG